MEGVQQIKDDVVVYGIGKEHNVRLRKVLEWFRQRFLFPGRLEYSSRDRSPVP